MRPPSRGMETLGCHYSLARDDNNPGGSLSWSAFIFQHTIVRIAEFGCTVLVVHRHSDLGVAVTSWIMGQNGWIDSVKPVVGAFA